MFIFFAISIVIFFFFFRAFFDITNYCKIQSIIQFCCILLIILHVNSANLKNFNCILLSIMQCFGSREIVVDVA
jgi:hypothetical protein